MGVAMALPAIFRFGMLGAAMTARTWRDGIAAIGKMLRMAVQTGYRGFVFAPFRHNGRFFIGMAIGTVGKRQGKIGAGGMGEGNQTGKHDKGHARTAN